MKINKTNDSYLKSHSIVKKDQIRKPHSGVSDPTFYSALNYLFYCNFRCNLIILDWFCRIRKKFKEGKLKPKRREYSYSNYFTNEGIRQE